MTMHAAPPTMPPAAELPRRDRLRLFHNGFVYSSPGQTLRAQRYSGTILLALGEADVELSINGGPARRCGAAALRPFVTRELRSPAAPYLCVDLSPNHPRYRLFQRIGGDGCLLLPRERLAPLQRALQSFHAGELSCTESRELMWRAADVLVPLLGEPPPLDERLQRVLALLEDNPACSAERLCQVACLSRDRLSHLFSEEVGISLRKYIQTMKIHAAARFFGSGLSLTEIAAAAGFADSAHFAKVWVQCFGASPARYFSSDALALYPLPRAIRDTVARHPDRCLREMLPATDFTYPAVQPLTMPGIA